MHRLEALPAELVHRPAHERQLQQHEVAAQVGEARARQARAALHVDPLAGQLEVVACLGRAPTASPTSREHRVLVGARSGRAGWAAARSAALQLGVDAARAPRSAPWPRPATSRIARDRLVGVLAGAAWPRRSPGWPRSARRAAPRARGRISRRRASSASTSSSAPTSASPRRASAARTASGSRRISLRSSTAPEPSAQPAGDGCGRRRRASCGAFLALAACPAYLARNVGDLPRPPCRPRCSGA